ncbi:MAG: hypothetical protein OXC01_10710 [Immundisolibacterales bacterium]|nr:hypothetical protein [Immundisolibacterales bacterium]
MRDGIELARRGIPAVALITEAFWPQAEFVARAAGMPGAPRIRLPHPVAGTGRASMAAVARSIRPAILAGLAGSG